MSTEEGTEAPSNTIPLVDISSARSGSQVDAKVAATVAQACETIGFLTIEGHGVPDVLLAEMYDTSKEFFALPLQEKEACNIDGTDGYTGYAGIGRINYSVNGPPNLNEQFHVNRFDSTYDALAAGLSPVAAASQVPNVWPKRPVAFERVWKAYYSEMERLAADMGRLFAAALHLPADAFDPYLDQHISNLNTNWYPPQPTDPLPGQVRSRTHIDFSLFTILYQDDTPGGLEVRDRAGTWHALAAVPGTYVVNLGDVMNRLTNDRWKATFHRVVNPPAEARHRGRISIPYFVTAAYDSVIDCVATCLDNGESHYEPISAGEYAEQRRSGRRGVTTV
jgi:isopenicillin N synthase-like dioxygenase